MQLCWWQQLPLLLLVHLLYAEASVACKSTIDGPQRSSSRLWRYICPQQLTGVNQYKLNDPGGEPLLPGSHSLLPHANFVKCSPSGPNYLFSSFRIKLQELYKSSSRKTEAAGGGTSADIPTLTPVESDYSKNPAKPKAAAIVGGVGAALLVIIFVVLVYLCLMHIKKSVKQNSDTESSAQSAALELERVDVLPYAGARSSFGTQALRHFSIEELQHATSNFSKSKIIGEGAFGLVYKGFPLDGSIVAVKRRIKNPIQNFFHEVKSIATINHENLVKLIGYYEDGQQQILVYDYVSNGNIGNYLYDSKGFPVGELDLRQRLLIALGAARGIQHLHGLVPPFLHMHFRTSNVLLTEKFTAKISDYGLSKLVMEFNRVGSSSAIDCFLDPELDSYENFSQQSDVYSFGVFLLELISGREADGSSWSNSGHNLLLHATGSDLKDFVDKTLGEDTMGAAQQMMKLALRCVNTCTERPSMVSIVQEIEKIQAREMGYLHSEEISSVILGSELFK
ncbi:hypothetical protein K2173_023587 [Erythroxylum novogranatense]|uniref:non-specific serine/threonine protein kinase n=1 Tax=Erythroxylum novogranatense TaxID=1862640 RepID=A0AAV8TR51_9ROSI|nr:hypothetical protein K2173_023587 [Erythroxylum novogranatense]